VAAFGSQPASTSGWVLARARTPLVECCPKLENHAAAVSLYVAHYNFCRVHEALTPDARHQNTPAIALGVTTHAWSIGELLDAALAATPREPTETAPDRRRRFRVIEGGKR
jgi:hypothetical protein